MSGQAAALQLPPPPPRSPARHATRRRALAPGEREPIRRARPGTPAASGPDKRRDGEHHIRDRTQRAPRTRQRHGPRHPQPRDRSCTTSPSRPPPPPHATDRHCLLPSYSSLTHLLLDNLLLPPPRLRPSRYLPGLPPDLSGRSRKGGPARSGGPPFLESPGAERNLGRRRGGGPLTSEINPWRSTRGLQHVEIDGPGAGLGADARRPIL